MKKNTKKTWTQNTLPTKFFGFLIGYHSETILPTSGFFRVEVLFHKVFESDSKFSNSCTLAFFLPFKIHQEIFLILIKSYNCEVYLSPNYLEKKFLICRCLHVLSYVSFRNELQFWGLWFHFCIANDHN